MASPRSLAGTRLSNLVVKYSTPPKNENITKSGEIGYRPQAPLYRLILIQVVV